ncbi:hypothetical protein AFEL58S_02034 [Afipia felis]
MTSRLMKAIRSFGKPAVSDVQNNHIQQPERYDYIPPGMVDPNLISLFPFAEASDPSLVPWPYLRSEVPHIWRSDTRNDTGYITGNCSVEEAVCLYSLARQFRGKRGLEIGSHYGWTGAHLLAAGLNVDFIDPNFSKESRVKAVKSAFDSLPNPSTYRLWPGLSPQIVPEVRLAEPEPWSFAFIDGNHDGDAPETDARTVHQFLDDDAIVVFHDLTSPFVERGLDYFRKAGFSVRLFNTMQILGIAWRGNVEIPEHVADPNATPITQEHLLKYLSARGDVEMDGEPAWISEIITKVQPFTMTSAERIAALCHAAEYVSKNRIAGDFVECGVWRGGSTMAAAITLMRLNDTSRSLYLFDTFEGMTPPTEHDVEHSSGDPADLLLKQHAKDDLIWAISPIDEVRSNLKSTGYPKLHFRKGRVEDTIPSEAPDQISILRLDTDWYESTKHELNYLYNRLSVGGVLIIDDYGHWDGARRAVDEFIENSGHRILLNKIDYTGRIAVKTCATPETKEWRDIDTAPRMNGLRIELKTKTGETFTGYFERHELFWDKIWVDEKTLNRFDNQSISHWKPAR